jgi:hypothetical protein
MFDVAPGLSTPTTRQKFVVTFNGAALHKLAGVGHGDEALAEIIVADVIVPVIEGV